MSQEVERLLGPQRAKLEELSAQRTREEYTARQVIVLRVSFPGVWVHNAAVVRETLLSGEKHSLVYEFAHYIVIGRATRTLLPCSWPSPHGPRLHHYAPVKHDILSLESRRYSKSLLSLWSDLV